MSEDTKRGAIEAVAELLGEHVTEYTDIPVHVDNHDIPEWLAGEIAARLRASEPEGARLCDYCQSTTVEPFPRTEGEAEGVGPHATS